MFQQDISGCNTRSLVSCASSHCPQFTVKILIQLEFGHLNLQHLKLGCKTYVRILFGEGGGSCGATQEGGWGSIDAPSCLLHCYFDFGCWLLCCGRCSSCQWDSRGEVCNLAVKKTVLFHIHFLPYFVLLLVSKRISVPF